MPEPVPQMVIDASGSNYGSPADVIPYLLEDLPKNLKTQHLVLFYLLVSIIKCGVCFP
jgi:hypothetical protein